MLKKNFVLLPTGQCGKDYTKLVTEWIQHFTKEDDSFKMIAMKVVMILPTMMLQKPSATSKAKDHSKALTERLQMWKDGKIEEIWKDNCIIQKKLSQHPRKSASDIVRVVSKLIFEGKVSAAMKYLEDTWFQPPPYLRGDLIIRRS